MLTLIDSLDTLLVFREFNLFFDALDRLKNLSFHRNIEVSVFEVNIRVLGGLLSSHQLANKLFGENSKGENHSYEKEYYSDEEEYDDFNGNDAIYDNDTVVKSKNKRNRSSNVKNTQNNKYKNSKIFNIEHIEEIQKKNYTYIYDGNFLLNFAKDLGDRILPAFQTQSGIPIQRINLLHGKNNTELSYTCTAAGSTFLLEMGLLSRLSGEKKREIRQGSFLKMD